MEIKRGFCSAKLIEVSEHGNKPLITLELLYPRFIHCFDDKTEILAVVGNDAPKFMSFKKAETLGAKVAQYEEGKISFVEPLAWIKTFGKHDMVKYENRKFSMMVTDKHRVFVNKRTTGNQFVPETWEASRLLGDYAMFRIPQSGHYTDGQKYSKEELALMVWFASDGTKQKDRICFHFRKQRKVDSVESLLISLGIEYVKRRYDDSTCIWCNAPAWVNDCYADSGEKKIPEDGLFMDDESYLFVKQAVLESDGSVSNREFNTTSVTFAEQVQVMAHLHGDAMNLRFYEQGEYKKLYKSKFKESNHISFRRDNDSFEKCVYEGTVYCVKVPSSYVLVRRNGIVFVSGNCEFMTHRVFSRNASSSRATPVTVTAQKVINEPVFFTSVGINKSGMQAGENVSIEVLDSFKKDWYELAKISAGYALKWSKEFNIHKQIVNRVLEPFSYIKVVVTATEWDNFIKLRLHPDADPTIQDLAYCINEIVSKLISGIGLVTPYSNIYHFPYLLDSEKASAEYTIPQKMVMSIARCARVSYLTFDNKHPTYEQDKKLFVKLISSEPMHASPFEHCAITADDNNFYANFRGWKSVRYLLEHGSIAERNMVKSTLMES